MNYSARQNDGTQMKPAPICQPAAPAYRPGRDSHTVYVLDREGRIIDTNETVAPLTGHSLEELADRPLGELLDPAEAKALEETLAGRETERRAAMETMVQCRDGRKRPARGWRICLRDEDGDCSGVMVYLEPALVWVAPESPGPEAERNDDLAEHVSDAVIDADEAGNVVEMNRAGRVMFGYADRQDAISSPLAALFDPLETDRALAALAKTECPTPLVAVMRRRDGKRFIGKITAYRLSSGGLRMVIQNLSSDRELERLGAALASYARAGRFSFAILDSDLRIVFLDPGFAARCGVERWEQMIGLPIGDSLRSGKEGDRLGPDVDRAMLRIPGLGPGARWKRVAAVGLGAYKLIVWAH